MLECLFSDVANNELASASAFKFTSLKQICFLISSARRSRVKRVREGLENSLRGRIELIDSYARVWFCL